MRTVTSTLNNAMNNDHGYDFLSKLEVFPTRIFFDVLDDDYPIAGADAEGIVDNPLKQDIAYNATAGGLVTFFSDGTLKYCVQGSSTVTSLGVSSSTKPGVFGNKLFVYTGTTIKRYSINWAGISLSEDVSMTPSKTPVAIHAISETECIALCDDDGGLRVLYINGTTEEASSSRFMFPKFVDWSGSARTMESLAIFSGAAKLGDLPFVYASNAGNGKVEGMYYDPDTDTWSDIFIALPTDLQVSLCEFRIANCYTRNNVVYLCGQFNRTDVYGTAKVYSLLLRSEDGRTFSIDNFTLVSDLNYRFLATVGSDNYLYIGNSNRVAYKPVTWYFDGDDDSTSLMLPIPETDIRSISDTDTNSLNVALKSGDLTYVDSYVEEYAKVKLYHGFKTSIGDEYILYGTYIIEAAREGYKDGSISFTFTATNLSTYKLTGLSMPFYAELLGMSSLYDPMNAVSGKLYAAPNMTRSVTSFQVDLWQTEGYWNAGQGISGAPFEDGAPNFSMTGSHKKGIITKSELSQILGLSNNPKLTATSLTVNIHGWSKASAYGRPNDTVNLILVHCDKDGNDEQTIITAESHHWKITYPYQSSGEEPIVLTLTGLTVDRYIKYVGLVFECAYETMAVPARIEFLNGVEVPVSLSGGEVPWTVDTDGTFKVPRAGQPFIMFSQRPYNTANFVLAAQFTNTITGQIAGYATAVGLVGLAQDASNCIVGRYDKTSSKAQLVKIRNGVETVLAEASPSWTVGETQKLQFQHRDGHFEIFMYDEDFFRFERVLDYQWKASDGFMYTSSTATLKCGIYGNISAPICRILPFSKNDTESSYTDGIPVDPLSSIDDFPSSGKLNIEGNVYNYSGKVSHPALCRGPFQVRNVGVYPRPYGNGKAGIEVRDLDWYASASLTTGKLIAIDNGDCYLSAGDHWQVFITTGGNRQYLPNRSRRYSNNSAIANAARLSTHNKVWVVGGFSGVSRYSGDPIRHTAGEWAILQLDGEIKCHWFMGAGGESDTTVEDLIGHVCKLSGAKANFPGDFVQASLVVNGETSIYQDDYAEGFDLSFELAEPLASFDIRANVKIQPDNYEEKALIVDDTDVSLRVEHTGSGNYVLTLFSEPSNTEMFKLAYSSGTTVQKFRVLFYGSNISLYQNHHWVTTITLDKLIYTQASYIDIKAYAGSATTFSNIRIKDLGDWRESVYIDLETDGNSAIGSIIQERPVEIVSQADGSLDFYYEYARELVTVTVPPITHEYSEQDPKDAGSDGIIYGMGDVQTIQYRKFAATKGLATKLIRVPNLDIGALEAAQRMMDRQYEARGSHTINMRPNLKVQPGDKLTFGYTLPGLVRSFTVIVESVTLTSTMTKGKTAGMTIRARNTLP